MLNPTFPIESTKRVLKDYVAPLDIASSTLDANSNFETGKELRLQNVFSDEIWLKLKRAGFSKEKIEKSNILEICAGNGFLTYSILSRCRPLKYTVNDISEVELNENKNLISSINKTFPTYIVGDIHNLEINEQFDIVIGNSFLHHFHDVPKALDSIYNLLNNGGVFISLHEPTPLSTFVESGKIFAIPFAILSPKIMNNIVRKKYKFEPSKTDLWIFESRKLKKIFNDLKFSNSKYYYWGLFRPIVVQNFNLHLTNEKQKLTNSEEKKLKFSIKLDSFFNKILPSRFFGSLCIVAKK